MKPYPKQVCWDCGNPVKKCRKVGAITVFQGLCGVYGKKKNVSTAGDYGWPDFKGFSRVKRAYLWD